MKKGWIGLVLVGILFAQQEFPICAFHVKDSTWFDSVGEDSLGLNTILFHDASFTKEKIIGMLNAADDRDLKVIAGHVRKGSADRDDILWYCQLHWGLWEAEDSSNFFHAANWWNGIVVEDSFAHNGTAFVAFVDSQDNQQMLKTLGDYAKPYSGSQFDAIFHLKINAEGLDDTVSVCSLIVTHGDTPYVADTILRVGDFAQTDSFQLCSLSYYTSSGRRYFCIKWLDNCDLWCDYIETKDRWIEALLAHDYFDILGEITQYYDGHPALSHYYLLDEPWLSYFESNAYVMNFLRTPSNPPHKLGMQVTSYYGPGWYETYVDSIKPNLLNVNIYPLKGDSCDGGATPKDSGTVFQGRLDTLCIQLSEAREAARDGNINFWFTCQAFGHILPDGSTQGLREPTPRELKCMIWLGLAHGAKGLDYFIYPSLREPNKPWVDSGLVDQSFSPPRHRDSLWIPAQEMNFTLQKIGSTVMELTSDTVFKSTDDIPPSCFIKEISSDSMVQIGTFYNADNDTFFIMVNRLCQASDSDTVVIKIHKDSLFLSDLYTGEAIAPDSVPSGSSYFSIPLPPAQGRFFQLIPFAQDFKINSNQAYTNMVHVALDTKAWAYASIDSMKIWQNYNDSLVDATGWMPYDTAYCRQLRQGEGTNTMYIQYKIDGNINSPEYSDVIMYDETAPTYSFVINDDNTFTNISDVTLKSSLTDATSGPSKMRYGNKELKNPVKNSSFDNADDWSYDHATYDDTLKLYEIPVQTAGNYFFQAIPPESLEAFEEDTMLLWIDLVSDDFSGTGRVEFQYIYGDTAVRHVHPVGCTISILEGTNAKVSEYNLYSFFEFRPDSDSVFTEARVGIWIDNDLGNSGKLYIDNFRLDLVGPADDYTRFENYDSLTEWSLISGNGVRKVWGQFADCVGNETVVSFDSIIVDTTKPARRISYPQNGHTISGTIAITGYAHDSLDHPQHFKQYELQQKASMTAIWYGIEPESLFTTPVYPSIILPDTLGLWNTTTVNDGWHDLKLTVADLAGNSNDTTISVRVNNDGPGDLGGFSGFSNYLYGLAAGNDVYIGEFRTGKIYQYNTNYELIDTFRLVDSVGTGFPLAMAIDDSGKLWVANSNSHLISKFTPQGSLLLRFAGGFSLPSGFAFDNSGDIWVSDRLHHKIKKFNQDGDSLFVFGTQGTDPGEINRPIGLAYYDDKLYIADSRNKRISVFDTLGNFIEIFADSTTLSMPFSIVIDSAGCLFVSDFVANRVLEYDPFGNPLYQIDTLLDSPTSLALSPDMNVLYVSDTRNKRVLAFQVRGEPPIDGGPQAYGDSYFDRLMFDVYPSLSAKQMNIRLQGFVGRRISLKVYDVTGRLIKTFYDDQMIKANQNISWDCKDDLNRRLSNGVYFVRLELDDDRTTRKTILLR